MVDEYPIYRGLSKGEANRRKRYREFMREVLRFKDAMGREMERRTIYGSEVFLGKLKKAYEMEEIIRLIGRPRRDKKIELLFLSNRPTLILNHLQFFCGFFLTPNPFFDIFNLT